MVGLITHTITMLETMRVADIMVTRKILPLLAGNFPRMIQYYSRLCQPQVSYCAREIEKSKPKILTDGGSGCRSGILAATASLEHTWLSKYLLPPMMRINTAIPKKVAPSGFPNCRSLVALEGCGFMPSRSDSVAFSRKSWVIAIPMEAKANEVRSQARKVRSYTMSIC